MRQTERELLEAARSTWDIEDEIERQEKAADLLERMDFEHEHRRVSAEIYNRIFCLLRPALNIYSPDLRIFESGEGDSGEERT